MLEQVLHLYITSTCGHKCPLCCNRLYDIEKIPVVTVELLKSVQTVCLTGGDPFDALHPNELSRFIRNLREQYRNIENLYIYTSGYMCGGRLSMTAQECYIDGINLAPKSFNDWISVKRLFERESWFFTKGRSSRLYVFKEQRPIFDASGLIDVIKENRVNIDIIDRQWTTEFNTPNNEHFARLPILF